MTVIRKERLKMYQLAQKKADTIFKEYKELLEEDMKKNQEVIIPLIAYEVRFDDSITYLDTFDEVIKMVWGDPEFADVGVWYAPRSEDCGYRVAIVLRESHNYITPEDILDLVE